MAGGAILIVHRVFMVKPWYLLYFIYNMLSLCSKLAATFKYGLSTDSASQNVFFVSSAHVLFEKRKGEEAFH